MQIVGNKEVTIIPLLIDETKMPAAEQFPDELRSLEKVHAERLRVDKLETDWGELQMSMIHIITESKLLDKALEDMTPDDMQELMDAGMVQLPKFVAAKAKSGEGFPEGQINLYGIWKCVATAPDERFCMQIEIEDRPDSLFTGELIKQDANGRDKSKHKMRGEWMRILDIDAKPTILLGLHLRFVLDEGNAHQFAIPFKTKIGEVQSLPALVL